MRFAPNLLAVLVLGLAACGKAAVAKPKVSSFTANPPTVAVGGTSTLAWNVQDYASCTLKSTQPPNFEEPAKVPSGSRVVTMGQISTVFLLTCTTAPATKGGATSSTTATAYVAIH